MSEYNPRALSIEEVVRALKAAGSRSITKETLQTDITSGFEPNQDGTIDIFKYAAWILKEDNAHGC